MNIQFIKIICLEPEENEIKKLKFIFKDPMINQTGKYEISVNLNLSGKEFKKKIFDKLLKENPTIENLGLTEDNILVNTNVGAIIDDKQLKTNTYINENLELLVFITEQTEEENNQFIEKSEERFFIKNSEKKNDNLYKKDNFDLSSINTKIENYSNMEYSETKNLLKDVLRLENNNYIDKNKEELLDDYLVRKQLFKEVENFFPRTLEYNTIPSLIELRDLSFKDLRKVENFSIYNKYGKITFKGKTDITFLDLDKIIKITEMQVVLYPDMELPPINEELNKPAIIEMYEYSIPLQNYDDEKESFSISERIIEDHKNDVENSIKEKGGKVIEFDLEKRLLIFEVPFFEKE